MQKNLSHGRGARLAGLLVLLSGCNSVLGIREGIAEGGRGAGGSGAGGAGGGPPVGGSGGASPTCVPACADADYGETEGPCAPEVLYRSQDALDQDLEGTGLVVDEARDRVIWALADAPRIMATPRSGGPSVVLTDVAVSADAFYPRALLLDGGFVYWNTIYDGAIGRLALDGVGAFPELVTLAPGLGLTSRLSVHGGEVLFTTMVSTEQEANPWCHDPMASGEPFAVCTIQHWRAAATGAQPSASPLGPAMDYPITGRASAGSRVYWTECDPSGGTIRYLEDGEVEPQTLLKFGGECRGELAVEPGPEGLIYWTTGTGIARATQAGQNLGPVAPASAPWALLVDATHVYWLEGAFLGDPVEDGTVRRALKTGGPAVVLASAHEPGDLAQDCGAVYWTESYNQNQPGSYVELHKIRK